MSGQKAVTPTAEGLAASVQAIKPRGLPPVHLWNPPYMGDLDIRIARDGTWFHEGGEIRRAALVRLFSSILRKEGDRFYLVTPVEKVGITVEDAPFVAVDLEASGSGADQVLRFETQIGDRVDAGPDTPLRFDMTGAAPAPYVMVRAGLEALIDRKTFYRLVDLGEDREGWFGVWSGGAFWPMMRSEALQDL